jgi:hypothetical protein
VVAVAKKRRGCVAYRTTSLNLDPNDLKAAEALALERDLSLSAVMRRALRTYLALQERGHVEERDRSERCVAVG